VRIYKPKADERPLPVIVYIHGGGWVSGDIAVADKPCRSLANAAGAAVVSVEYPKTRTRPHPRTATRPPGGWPRTPPRSASGRRESQWRGTARAATWRPRCPLWRRTVGARRWPTSCSSIRPWTPRASTVGGGERRGLPAHQEGYGLGIRAGPDRPSWAKEPYCSPIRGDLSGLSPATVVTAGYDPLLDEGNADAPALAEAGVPVEYLENPTMIHGFFWMMGAVDHTRSVYDATGRRLRRAFGMGRLRDTAV
jgi:acetyl esterase